MFLFLLIWIFAHAGGIGWRSEPQLEFNLHPMAMSFGLVFLNGEAITVYRGARNFPKQKTKLIHMLLQLVAGILSIFGLLFAFDSHNFAKPPIPNLYSLHSWMGISAVLLFVGQWIGSFFVYWLPYSSLELRQRIMPIHRFSGVANFVLVLCSAMLGYSEKAAWMSTKNAPPYSATLIVANLFGLSMALYGITVLLVVTTPSWIRKPLPHEVTVPLTQEDRDHDE
ncbi:hypothetical protein FO519_004210 [Halicephalobus sp. NKZ332]|nr:hypothetical protein FO519_004210 [Halicephalobus sp. NKZ332]